MTDKQKARIQLLVDALRSGEYEQGQAALRTEDKYCCLGVACDVYRKHNRNGKWVAETDSMYSYRFSLYGDSQGGVLPEIVAKWYGFGRNPNPGLNFEAGYASATFINDHSGLDFSQIANAFEKTFLMFELRNGGSGD